MTRAFSRLMLLALLAALVIAGPIGLVNARSVQPQSGELLTNPGFEEPFVLQDDDGLVATGWRAWFLTPDGVRYPIECPQQGDPECKVYRTPGYHPSQPQDRREPPRAISDNSQQWGTSFAVFIGGIYQQVDGLKPGTRLQFSAFTQAFNCSDDRGCFGWAGQEGRSYEPGYNSVRVGIDPTGGTDPYSPNIVWSAYANPLDAFILQSVEAVAQSATVTVYVWSAPEFPEKHVSIYVDNASLVATGEGPIPTTVPTIVPTTEGTPAATATPAGSPTPVPTLPPGTTTYTVVTGDTLSIIARRFNLTLDQILALNPNITSPSVIAVGQVINVVGTPSTPNASTATAVPTATPSPTTVPTATPIPQPEATTAVEPSPEATATPMQIAAASGLCVQAFDDINANLIRDEGEALVMGVTFNIKSADSATAVDYITDGQQEPHCFTTLSDGRYTVNTQLPADRTATTDSAWNLSLLTGTNVSIVMGTRAEATPVPTATATPPPSPLPALGLNTSTNNSGNASSLALLGGGALILLAGVVLVFGLRSRRKSA